MYARYTYLDPDGFPPLQSQLLPILTHFGDVDQRTPAFRRIVHDIAVNLPPSNHSRTHALHRVLPTKQKQILYISFIAMGNRAVRIPQSVLPGNGLKGLFKVGKGIEGKMKRRLINITHSFRCAVLYMRKSQSKYGRRYFFSFFRRDEDMHLVKQSRREKNIAIHVSNEIRSVEGACCENHVLQNW